MRKLSSPVFIALTVLLIGLAAFTVAEIVNSNSEVDDLETTIATLEGDKGCKRKANEPPEEGRRPLKKPITLTAEPAVGIVNFGTDRSMKSLYFVLKASRRLPPGLKPKHIELSVPRPPLRISDTLESASLALPKFSRPRFINGRKEIQFRMCVNAAGIEPGTFTSQVFVGGPKGLNGTSVTATITAKNGIFWPGAVIVLLAAAGLLIVMVVQDLGKSSLLIKLTTVLGSLIAAGAAMYAVYASDPAWGADPLSSILALGATAFAAAGLGSFITTIFKHGKDKGKPGTGK